MQGIFSSSIEYVLLHIKRVPLGKKTVVTMQVFL